MWHWLQLPLSAPPTAPVANQTPPLPIPATTMKRGFKTKADGQFERPCKIRHQSKSHVPSAYLSYSILSPNLRGIRNCCCAKCSNKTHRITQIHIGHLACIIQPACGFELIPLCFKSLTGAAQAHFDEEVSQKVINDLRKGIPACHRTLGHMQTHSKHSLVHSLESMQSPLVAW